MPNYYVEGIYLNKEGAMKQRKTGEYPPVSLEPYGKTMWANSPKEAIQLATAELAGGKWIEGPRVSQVTEEQRMRSKGSPEFPELSQKYTQAGMPAKKGKH